MTPTRESEQVRYCPSCGHIGDVLPFCCADGNAFSVMVPRLVAEQASRSLALRIPARNNQFLPCPFCGGTCDPQGWMDALGTSGPECESCGATAASLEQWQTRVSISIQVIRNIDDGPAWAEAPDWAQYRAQNVYGDWFWYSEKPAPFGSMWTCGSMSTSAFACAGFPNENWLTTLEQRPKP